MQVIDLLNKIANGEASDLKTYFIFEGEKYNFYQFSKIFAIDINSLNWEIEIVEDKKIEKLESYISCGWHGTCEDLSREDLFNDLSKIGNKINEIIDCLNKGVDKE